MSQRIEVADCFPEERVVWRDKTLVITRQSYYTEGLFKAHLEREAFAAVARNRDVLGDQAFKEAIAALAQDAACRTYAWGMPVAGRALDNVQNLKHFFWLVITQPGQNGKPSENARLPREVMDEIWPEVGDQILEAWARVTNLPNPPTPPMS